MKMNLLDIIPLDSSNVTDKGRGAVLCRVPLKPVVIRHRI